MLRRLPSRGNTRTRVPEKLVGEGRGPRPKAKWDRPGISRDWVSSPRTPRRSSGALRSESQPLSTPAVAFDLRPSSTPGACGRSAVNPRTARSGPRTERDGTEASLLEAGEENARLGSPKSSAANLGRAPDICAKEGKPALEQGRASASRASLHTSPPARRAARVPAPPASVGPVLRTHPGEAPGRVRPRPPRLRVGPRGSAPPWTGPTPSPPSLSVSAFYSSRSGLQPRRHVLASSGRLQIFSFHSS